MDDADLAGPIIFVFCFGIFLLFVSERSLERRTLNTRSAFSLENKILGISTELVS